MSCFFAVKGISEGALCVMDSLSPPTVGVGECVGLGPLT